MQEKKCNVCQEVKFTTEFYPRIKGKFGVTAQCRDCMKIAGKGYYSENKEKVDAKNKRNAEKNKEAYKETQKNWQQKNQKKRNAQARKRYEKNKEKESVRSKEYFKANPEYRFEYYRKNKEHLDNLTKQWKLDNPGKFTGYYAKRRAAELNATLDIPGDSEKITEIYKESARLTAKTGIKHEVDHVIPLQGKEVKGLHVSWNLQILTQTENRRKRNLVDATVNISNRQTTPEGERREE